MDRYKVTLTFTEPLLGTVPKDPEVYKSYIASKGDENADELQTLEDLEEKGWTGFHRLDGNPMLYDYQLKGFFKDACSMLARSAGSKSAALKAYKKVIDGLVFVKPRRIPIILNGDVSVIERPLRAQTAKGERVTLTRSDAVPVGSRIEFEVSVLGVVSQALLTEWLAYGALRGLGQWRNGGWGAFEYELESLA